MRQTNPNKNKMVKKILVFIVVAILATIIEYYQSSNETYEAPATSQEISIVEETEASAYINYQFRNDELLNDHFYRHGMSMGFDTAAEYEKAASDVINNQNALHKIEKEDGDDVYYLEDSNEFVILSTDGYIRTYFEPDNGISYFNKQ